MDMNKGTDINVGSIEEDIKILENLKKYLNLLIYEGTHKIIYNNLGWDEKTIDCINAIDHILAEREEDKKRIKELEVLEDDLKDKRIAYIDTPEFEEKFIAKQKVKEELEKAKKENEPYEIHNKESRMFWINQGKIRLAKKLLEDK